ncbi:probable U3 small nucleolar RNA-associated protein 11 [Saccharomycodes ludwigii]|uniref:U3 small nucleolar RNA-associated protein 11 n=1 Tax=Saccharomycodes ludwigii TaxID=36035 RepID=A0A376B9Q4_9ASCO|nr:hypothetical protein SCDLUD_004019 [Saccharomycodes ludwigii]KAH3899733.1 hypothetical protein SCDLUD_004019 [Saccharomycodes ludwigii]SSD61351.1 probable U3 small nucleolar RNA-associated protein 11 [Saccharomycodes ludwigii]
MAKLVHNIQKKQHRERSQLHERSKYGFLEKHKDYVKRAKNYHEKQNTLKVLRSKVNERNPDEFYYGMNSKKIDSRTGLLITNRHGSDNNEDSTLSMDQVKLLKTQDTNYIRTMRMESLKKLEKNKKTLMFKSKGEHKIFVDNDEELYNFKPEEYFNTPKEMLKRSENRLTVDQLENYYDNKDNGLIMPKESLEKRKLKKFKIVKQYIERENKLKQVEERMALQREVMKKGSKKRIVGDNGKVTFKWKKQRKR